MQNYLSSSLSLIQFCIYIIIITIIIIIMHLNTNCANLQFWLINNINNIDVIIKKMCMIICQM